jgi:hypothetical protein
MRRITHVALMVAVLLLAIGCSVTDPAPAPAAASEPAPAPDPFRMPSDPPPIPPGHLACRADADCVRVFRHCGTCDCGAPLARAWVAQDAAEREARCRDVVGPVCEMDCGRTQPRCRAGRCELAGADGGAGG